MWRWLAFAGASVASIAVVTTLARRHSADPARCAALVAMGNRCCAEGQEQRDGTCVGRPLRCPPPFAVTDTGCVAPDERIIIAAGVLRVGAADWEAEGRVRAREIHVASFAIDAIEITEGAYAACVAAGRCGGEVASAGEPGRARGGITRAEAESYCAFQGGRLPTADEWTFAAAGPSARRYPWGDTGAVCRRASWGLSDGPCGFGHAGPELAGRQRMGRGRTGRPTRVGPGWLLLRAAGYRPSDLADGAVARRHALARNRRALCLRPCRRRSVILCPRNDGSHSFHRNRAHAR
jgi:formylglycine-generating enzyme required for sulfatase activity